MVGYILSVTQFYISWAACLFGANHGAPIIGPVVVLGLLTLHLSLTRNRKQDALLILFVGLIGSAIETALILVRLYAFTGPSLLWICPVWMTALWMSFGATLNHSMRWLHGHYGRAAVLGAIGGPLSYYAGVRLGALTFLSTLEFTLSVLAISWALIVPSLIFLTELISARYENDPCYDACFPS